MSTTKQATWYTIVWQFDPGRMPGTHGRRPPRGPWRTPQEAREALAAWAVEVGPDVLLESAGCSVAGPYASRETARGRAP